MLHKQDCYKIGYSDNSCNEDLLSRYRTQLGFPIIIHTRHHSNPSKLEKHVHNHLEQYRQQSDTGKYSEWFVCPIHQIMSAISQSILACPPSECDSDEEDRDIESIRQTIKSLIKPDPVKSINRRDLIEKVFHQSNVHKNDRYLIDRILSDDFGVIRTRRNHGLVYPGITFIPSVAQGTSFIDKKEDFSVVSRLKQD